jgi:hypothetical protein
MEKQFIPRGELLIPPAGGFSAYLYMLSPATILVGALLLLLYFDNLLV